MKDTKNVKIFNIVMWTLAVIIMPLIAIPTLIGMLIAKKVSTILLKNYFGIDF